MSYSDSNTFSIIVSASGGVATYGFTGTSMTMEGFESARAFDDIQVRNGMLIEQGGNNHSYENNNGIRYYDPATNTAGYIEPWLKSAPFIQGSSDPNTILLGLWPNGYVMKNQYIYTHDNNHQMWLPSVDKLVDLSGTGGIYDFATSQWTHGGAPPFVDQPTYVNSSGVVTSPGVRIDPNTDKTAYIDMDAVAISAWGSGQQFYDGFRAYVPDLTMGIWIGGGTGGGGYYIGVLKENPAYPETSTKPWIARCMGALEGVFPFRAWSRTISNGVVFDVTKIFIGGGLTRNHSETNYDCYVIDVAPCKTMQLPTVLSHYSGVLSGFPVDMGMCHWVLDTTRNRVIKVGRKVLAWSLDTEGPWVDISPSDWGYGFAWTKAMYYAAHDRIYFKGSKITNASDVTETSSLYGKMYYIAF